MGPSLFSFKEIAVRDDDEQRNVLPPRRIPLKQQRRKDEESWGANKENNRLQSSRLEDNYARARRETDGCGNLSLDD